jgi:hypothetical protein
VVTDEGKFPRRCLAGEQAPQELRQRRSGVYLLVEFEVRMPHQQV